MHPNDKLYKRLEPEDPVNSEEYLKEILKRFNIDPSDPQRQLRGHWSDIVGENIGKISSCTGVKDGVAEVVCSHPAQIQLVKINKREIIKKIEAVLPELKVRDIKVSLDRKNYTS